MNDRLNRYERACKDQGFDLEYIDEPPIDTPEGWKHGGVWQTGGMIMVRTWQSEDWPDDHTENGQYQYQVSYGQDPGVALQKHEWDESYSSYVFAETIETRTPEDNDDHTKAQLAKELMETFDPRDH